MKLYLIEYEDTKGPHVRAFMNKEEAIIFIAPMTTPISAKSKEEARKEFKDIIKISMVDTYLQEVERLKLVLNKDYKMDFRTVPREVQA